MELTADREITQQHLIYQGNLETILFFGGPIEVEWRIIKEQPILTFCIHYSAKHRKYVTFRVKLYTIYFFLFLMYFFVVCQRPTTEFPFQGLIKYYCIALFEGCCFSGCLRKSREHACWSSETLQRDRRGCAGLTVDTENTRFHF